jgi:hypothetical protein
MYSSRWSGAFWGKHDAYPQTSYESKSFFRIAACFLRGYWQDKKPGLIRGVWMPTATSSSLVQIHVGEAAVEHSASVKPQQALVCAVWPSSPLSCRLKSPPSALWSRVLSEDRVGVHLTARRHPHHPQQQRLQS